MGRTASPVPTEIQTVQRRLERWRKVHVGRVRLPARLWAAAAEAARQHGVSRTAQVLRLQYDKLKRLSEGVSSKTGSTAPSAKFVELIAPHAEGMSECLIELEGPQGKMRIQWKGTTSPDLAGLSRALWERP